MFGGNINDGLDVEVTNVLNTAIADYKVKNNYEGDINELGEDDQNTIIENALDLLLKKDKNSLPNLQSIVQRNENENDADIKFKSFEFLKDGTDRTLSYYKWT